VEDTDIKGHIPEKKEGEQVKNLRNHSEQNIYNWTKI